MMLARTTVTTLLAAGLASAAAPSLAAPPRVLLPSPSFEAARAGAAPGWVTRAWAGGDRCTWTVESPGRTGRRCVSIRSDAGADAAWTATVPVEPGAHYRLSGWIRTRRVRGAVGALLNIQNLQQVRTARVRGDSGWTRVEVRFASGAESRVEVNCLFGGWGRSTGQAWFDDITLERIEPMSEPTCATVRIDAGARLMPYSRRLFGGFIEHFDRQVYGGIFEPGSPLADERGFRTDVIAALRDLKLSIVRWPGGCFASGYHWRDGVGPVRKPTPDPVWGVTDPNTFGTDEFVEWCRRVGCEPYICTNAGNGTPEEMRDWVAYCSRPGGPAVRTWSIGNENWGGHEIGARTADEWGPLVRRSADLMLAANPRLELLAAATPEAGWTMPLLAAAGSKLRSVAIHEYWLPCWGENLMPDYLTCIMNSEGPESTITRVVDLLDDAGVRGRIGIAFDEWNLRGWHHPGFPRKEPTDPADTASAALVRAREKSDTPSQYTMADALFSASFLNACLRHAPDVAMANIAPIVNTRGPLFVHPGGIVKRTTYHVLYMYARMLGERVAAARVETPALTHAGRSVAALDAVATCDPARKRWCIALVNRRPDQPLECEVRLAGKPLEGRYAAWTLSGDSPEAYNSIERPDRVMPQRVELECRAGKVMLPPHSLTVVEVVLVR